MDYILIVNTLFGIFSNQNSTFIEVTIYMSIYERVKQLCEMKGITIAELERKADLGNGSVRRWDKSIPSADKLQRTSIILGTSMEYLLNGTEKSEDLSVESTILARKANSLTKEQLDVVMNIIDQFNKK